MAIVRIDYSVVVRLLVARFKSAAFPVLMPSEPERDGVELYSRLMTMTFEPTRRVSGDGQPDHAKVSLSFAVCGSQKSVEDGGDGAVAAVMSDLMTFVDETPYLTDATTSISVELDRPNAEIMQKLELASGFAFASVNATGRAIREQQIGSSTLPTVDTPRP